MDRSFDVTKLTLSDAADLVAMNAQVGYSRSGREKQAMGNMATGALIGGGLGLGAGLLGSMGDEERRKNWLTNALSGGLIGAGVGAAGGMGYDAYKNLQGAETPEQKAVRELTAAKSQEVRPPVQDHTLNWLAKVTGFNPDLPTVNPKTGVPYTDVEMNAMRSDPTLAPGMNTNYQNAMEYITRPGDVALGGAVGYGTGHMADRFMKGPFDASKVMGLTNEQVGKLGGNVGHDVSQFRDTVSAARGLGGDLVQPGWLQRMKANLTGQTPVPRFRNPGDPLTGTPVTTQQTWNSMRRPVMGATRTPRMGKVVGTGLGMFLAPTISRAMQTAPGPHSSVPMLDD